MTKSRKLHDSSPTPPSACRRLAAGPRGASLCDLPPASARGRRHFSGDTEMLATSPTHRKALIYVAADQLDQLQNIAQHATAPGSALLRQELERAIVLTEEDSPRVFVRLNSTVQFEDLLTGRTRRLA